MAKNSMKKAKQSAQKSVQAQKKAAGKAVPLEELTKEQLIDMVRSLQEENRKAEKKNQAMCDALRVHGLPTWQLLQDSYSEEALEKAAAKMHLHIHYESYETGGLKTLKLAKTIADHILEPANFKWLLCTFAAEELPVLEKAASYWGAWYEAESDEEFIYLENLYTYLHVVDRNMTNERKFCVSTDACALLRSVLTDEFRREHALISYVYMCTTMLFDFYVIMPMHEFGNLVRCNKKLSSYTDNVIRRALDKIPEDYRCFTFKNGNLLVKGSEDSELAFLRKYQRDLPFYDFSPEEVLEHYIYEYPRKDPLIQEMFTFLTGRLGLSEQQADKECRQAWKSAYETGNLTEHLLPAVAEREKKPEPAARDAEEWYSMLGKLNCNTRTFKFRGHTLAEAVALQRKALGKPADPNGKMRYILGD